MPDTTVLVVDPDGTRRAETADTIREQVQGVSVLQAGSLAEARRHLGDGDADVDALVTEYDLGDGTGLELADHVRSLPRDIGCVLYTAEQDIETDSFEETVVWHVTDEDDPEALGLAVEGVGPAHSQAAYPLPENEDQRLAVVEAHADADGALVGPLTRLSTLAATHFGAETASVNLVREHTQEFLAHHGGEWAPTAREDSICTYTVLEDRTMAVPDTREDPRLAVVDATGSRDVGDDPDALTGSVSSTGDLTGISIEYSILHSALSKAGTERIRTCFDAVSTLLLYVSFPTVVRFVHTMAGRVAKTDGFGVFVLDPTMHEPQVTKTLERLCDGRISLRRADESEREGHELRIDGLAGQPLGWSPVDLG